MGERDWRNQFWGFGAAWPWPLTWIWGSMLGWVVLCCVVLCCDWNQPPPAHNGSTVDKHLISPVGVMLFALPCSRFIEGPVVIYSSQ